MVQPDPHGLQRIDLEFLLKMHKIVNVVIGIAKADTLTAGEISAVKAAISADIQRHDIELYTPEADFDTNMEIDTQTATDGQTSSVFSVFSSTKRVKVDGNLMLGREYPWGSITITNEKISDFTKLRNMLVCSHMLDLIDRTNLLYEQFRTDELLKLGLTNTTSLMNEFKIKDDKLQEQLKAIEDMSQKLICKVENDAAAQYEDAYKLYEDNQRDLLARLTKEKEKMQAYEVLTKAPMRVARTG
ncbi:hypothetical protein SARC_06680 [Sphaeroforma arctica JP610]|uniref:Septin-type G domain-containing protein n=1 Tax=Sphaeroforma arctica JP610 TaxID=667725 RepID=A0A0L0FYD3_9EUKA|nr:hypothetical protein SARC_06680 [Sphaeroforma arctica JP610]KNC80978.1 hypothetical protein SARC_06680 [Sphaeroforma arctica JP610]|eukprot:XP_014154880.1 hypothetical protein SARC_06680 [Sphaeroforma arctica JP610]